MKKAVDICGGNIDFSLSNHNLLPLKNGVWQAKRIDKSVYPYLPLNCLTLDGVWIVIKDYFVDTNPIHTKFWELYTEVLREGLSPIWGVLQVTDTDTPGKRGSIAGRELVTGLSALEWIQEGNEYDVLHASESFNERDYIALSAFVLQRHLATFKELTGYQFSNPDGQYLDIFGESTHSTNTSAGKIELVGDRSPYGGKLRVLANSTEPSLPFQAGYYLPGCWHQEIITKRPALSFDHVTVNGSTDSKFIRQRQSGLFKLTKPAA
ncbi:MAG: hypothetical protein FWC79_00385 [Oscillospiraceae bacterium]|nr:hypothetical protein [Oscillospiraceae bacterium]